MEKILDFAKRVLLDHIKPHGTYVDFTMGNGNDTLFFAQHSENGIIYSFDIQKQALENTDQIIPPAYKKRIHLILDNHQNFQKYLGCRQIDAGIFNLGYLPKGDKSITTHTETTLIALKLALAQLSSAGILLLVLYPGHPEGHQESIAVEEFCRNLNGSKFDVVKYDFLNKEKPPYAIAITYREK